MSSENKQSKNKEKKGKDKVIQWEPRRSVMTDILKEAKKEKEEKK